MRILKTLSISHIFNLLILILCILHTSKSIRVNGNNVSVMDRCGSYIPLRINHLYFNGILRSWSIYSHRIKTIYYGKITRSLRDVIYRTVNLHRLTFGFWNDSAESWFCLTIYKHLVIFYIFFNKAVSGVQRFFRNIFATLKSEWIDHWLLHSILVLSHGTLRDKSRK